MKKSKYTIPFLIAFQCLTFSKATFAGSDGNEEFDEKYPQQELSIELMTKTSSIVKESSTPDVKEVNSDAGIGDASMEETKESSNLETLGSFNSKWNKLIYILLGLPLFLIAFRFMRKKS